MDQPLPQSSPFAADCSQIPRNHVRDLVQAVERRASLASPPQAQRTSSLPMWKIASPSDGSTPSVSQRKGNTVTFNTDTKHACEPQEKDVEDDSVLQDNEDADGVNSDLDGKLKAPSSTKELESEGTEPEEIVEAAKRQKIMQTFPLFDGGFEEAHRGLLANVFSFVGPGHYRFIAAVDRHLKQSYQAFLDREGKARETEREFYVCSRV